MKKEKINTKTYEGQKIYNIVEKANALSDSIDSYISFNGYTSAAFTGTGLYALKSVVDTIQEAPNYMVRSDLLYAGLLALAGAILEYGHLHNKKEVNKNIKDLSRIVSNEKDYFTNEDAYRMLKINKDMNKLIKASHIVAAVAGILISTATYLAGFVLNSKNNFSMKEKLLGLGFAAFYYALAGTGYYLNKSNKSLINSKTGMLANNLIKPYTTAESTLKIKRTK